MTRVIFVRHGETETNAQGKVHKFEDNDSLTPKGIDQITKTANKLKDYSPSVIYTSKEKRAQESAKIIAEILRLPPQLQDGLEERNWGKYAGMSFGDIKKETGMDQMNLEERYTFTPNGGESWKDFETRLITSLNEIVKENQDNTVVIVTHSGVIRALIPYLMNIGREESFKYDPANASISIFESENGIFKMISINNTQHLNN